MNVTPALSGLSGLSGVVSSALVGDRYVSPTGSDSNDGLTRETAWASFTKLSEWLASLSSGNHSAVVLAGDYVNTGELSLNNNSTLTLQIDFEESVTVDNSAAVTRMTGIDHTTSNASSVMVVNLRGAVFTGASAGSANGIGTSGPCDLTINGATSAGTKAIFQGYDDGVSFHGTSGDADKMQINDCIFRNCNKSAFQHVNSSKGTHNRCEFVGRVGSSNGIGRTEFAGSVFNDCTFEASNTFQTVGFLACELNRCIIGTLGGFIPTVTGFTTGASQSQFNDCYFNASTRTHWLAGCVVERCFGSFRIDTQTTGSGVAAGIVRNCVFTGFSPVAKSQDTMHPVTIINTVYANCSQLGSGFGTTTDSNWLASGSSVDHCCLFNTSVRSQIAASVTNEITTDPLIGPANTTNQADWAVANNSPCVGAGTNGGNIGFTLADIS